MRDGLDIGKFIYNELLKNKEIKKIAHGNIHPLAIKQDIRYPYVIYKRTALVPAYTKDKLMQEVITIQMDCISNSYSESIELASLIKNCLDDMRKEEILFIRLEDAKEELSENAFVQSLIFSIKLTY